MSTPDLSDALFESHPTPLLLADARTRRIAKTNAAARALLGAEGGDGATLAGILEFEDGAERAADAFARAESEDVPCRLRGSGAHATLRLERVRAARGEALLARLQFAPGAAPGAGRESDGRETDEAALLRIAGRVARFGGWRVDLDSERVTWSDGTAAIHGAPPGTSPNVSEGVDHFAEEWRPTIRAAFDACARDGVPYDIVLQLVTMQGRRVWTRTVGEPERDAAGRIIAVRGAFQDLSELMDARARSEDLAARLDRLLQSMGDAFIALDRDWRIVYSNQTAALLVGQSRAALEGRVLWDAFPDAKGTIFEREYEAAMESGEPAAFETFYAPLGKWVEVRAHPYGDGLGLFFRDITEARARDAEFRLIEAAISRSNDTVLITEAEPIDAPDGPRIVWVNDGFERGTGFTRAEAIGATPRILQGPGTSRETLDRIRDALANWRSIREELLNYTKSGEPHWIELDIAPIANAEGWYTHWVAVQRDITARKRAERALARQAEMLDEALDAIIACDSSGRIAYWNRSAARLYGRSAEEAIGAPAAEVFGGDVRLCDEAERVVRASGRWTGRLVRRRADGEVVTVESRWTLIRGQGPDDDLTVVFDTDLTERLALEAQLSQANRLEAVGQLTGGVAHDFNNLLTVILGNADLLLETASEDDPARALLQTTVTAAERGAELVARLLSFARRQPLDPRAVDLPALVSGMLTLLERTLGENVQLEVHAEPDLPAAEIDPPQFESALLNLCLNARDAMAGRGGGRLVIDVGRTALDEDYARRHEEVVAGDYLLVSVTDQGEGMSAEVAARVFEPFFTTKAQGEGTGLGLSMVFGFVKQSGGHVKIYSEPGQGTTVRVYLPLARDEIGARAAPEALDPRGGETVLLVEDDDLVRGHARRLLEGLGYAVIDAADGLEALEIARSGRHFDILFTDVVMPGGLSGRDLALRVGELRPGLPVLYASGYTENAVVHHGRLDPGVLLLQKPYRRGELARKLRVALGSPRAG